VAKDEPCPPPLEYWPPFDACFCPGTSRAVQGDDGRIRCVPLLGDDSSLTLDKGLNFSEPITPNTEMPQPEPTETYEPRQEIGWGRILLASLGMAAVGLTIYGASRAGSNE
jgi:hypothetical protein